MMTSHLKNNRKRVQATPRAVVDTMCPLNLTDWSDFPWWVFMANPHSLLFGASRNGINEIFLVVENGQKHMVYDGEGDLGMISEKGTITAITEAKYLALRG